MGNLYEKLLDKIVKEFEITDKNHIQIIQEISSGFSGAEVYLIELFTPSAYTGRYFLKLDTSNQEVVKQKIAIQFSHATKILKYVQIDNYYVSLIEVAGNSQISYQSFTSLPFSQKKELIPQIISEILIESFSSQKFKTENRPFSEICKKFLKNKIKDEGVIYTLLRKFLTNPTASTILLQNELYPNALYFTRQSSDNFFLYDLPATNHGDLHAENLFVSEEEKNYTIIDWDSSTEDGFLFYDSAYLEFSILLNSTTNYSFSDWIAIVQKVSDEMWDELNFQNSQVINLINTTETKWIGENNTEHFSHIDKMKLGQIAARVLVALNFAGKKALDISKQEKAFIFACIFLKKLLFLAGYQDWISENVIKWRPQYIATSDESALAELREYCTDFSNLQKYILIQGSSASIVDDINYYLARFAWAGVISLSKKADEKLHDELEKKQFIHHIQRSDNHTKCISNLQAEATWWMFAEDYDDDQAAQPLMFSKWRNTFSKYLEGNISEICKQASPQNLMLIIDSKSIITADEQKKIFKILELFDLYTNTTIEVAILNRGTSSDWIQVDLENVSIKIFDLSVDDLAYFALTYLTDKNNNSIWLPHVDKVSGTQLSESDKKYITSALEIIGIHLLTTKRQTTTKKDMYWGTQVTWEAIHNQVPIDRPEVEDFYAKIVDKIQKEQWGRININYSPGSGATVLCKVLCWKLYKHYPTVQIKKINDDIFESIKRISNLTGLPVIILLDGNATHGNLELVEAKLKSELVKYILLSTLRSYSRKGDEQNKMLSYLESVTAERFEREYGDELSDHGNYSDQEERKRLDLLRILTSNQKTLEFRTPFFYGMSAFEKDFLGVTAYIQQIINKINVDAKFKKIISYISLVTYFSTQSGLKHDIVQEIFIGQKISSKDLLQKLYENCAKFLYFADNSYQICHPFIAYKILLEIYGDDKISLATTKFVILCKEFIEDMYYLGGEDMPSEYVTSLISNLFIDRGPTGESDEFSAGQKKNNFAPLILSLSNANLQLEVFSLLVKFFTSNPHCFQHYGRLIIYTDPSAIVNAKRQYDKAIDLDPTNPSHYHARGTMYIKYFDYLLDRDLRNSSAKEFVSGCQQTVESALSDFETSVEIATQNSKHLNSITFLSYPYNSIVKLCCRVIDIIMKKKELRFTPEQFWSMKLDTTDWARRLLSLANQYDFIIEGCYPAIQENTFYAQTKLYLQSIKLKIEDVEKYIKRNPNDVTYKVIYLANIDMRKDHLSKKTQSELRVIYDYCEEVIITSKQYAGVLWKWFYVLLHMADVDYAHSLGFLESLPDKDSSITVNYLLQVLYFSKYMQTQNPNDANRALHYIDACHKISINDESRTKCKCYLSTKNKLSLTYSQSQATKFPCRVAEEIQKPQNAKIKLELNSKFKAFIVPHSCPELKVGQGFNLPVDAIIGFSYSGLRGFDLHVKELV